MSPDAPDIVFVICHDLGRHLSVYGQSNLDMNKPLGLERVLAAENRQALHTTGGKP